MGVDEMLEAAGPDLKAGHVVVMHDGLGAGSTRPDCAGTVELIEPLAAEIRSRGLSPAPLEDGPAFWWLRRLAPPPPERVEIAIVVLDAVGSLTAQDVPLEIVLSHSGGGPTPDLVRDSFPDARIASSDSRRSPGAARDAGLLASEAPYVAFLAGDCRARPGWAAGRLRRHGAGAEVVASVMAPPRGPAAALASFLMRHSYRMRHVHPAQTLRFGASYSRSLLDRFGPFSEDLLGEEDVELNARVVAAGIEIQLAPEVVTEHAYPLGARELVADGYRRGTNHAPRRARRASRLALLAGRALFDGPAGMTRALRPGSPLPRAEVARAAPLVMLGALAYSAGTLRRG